MKLCGVFVLITLAMGCSNNNGAPESVTTDAVVTASTVPTGSVSPPTTAPVTTNGGDSRPAPLIGLAVELLTVADFPILMTARPGDPVALLAERGGIIREISAETLGEPVLDLSSLVGTSGEGGLLGLAIHPEQSDRIFVHYTDRGGDTVISEFALDGDISAERVLLTVDQPASNHNGGMIQFGPDDALYVGLGDGGGAGDRFGNGQNLDSLLGGIVRIDVDTAESTLWQYGLRNPWRFWIDEDNIWIGDVGQNAFEEIDLAPIAERGLNYGWPITEGNHCFQTDPCDTVGLTPPLIEIVRGDGGTCSITGGLVYRGSEIPEMDGRFFFSDFCGGYLRSVGDDGMVMDHDVAVGAGVVSFGLDGHGEMYVLTTAAIMKVVAVR